MKKIAILAAAFLASGVAQAQTAPSPIYGEIGYTALNADVLGVDLDVGVVRGMLGYELNPNLALEAMLAFGANDDSVSNGIDTVKVKVENAYGLYLKPKARIADGLELYGRLGFAESKIKATLVGYGSESDSDNDVSYGVGLKYEFAQSAFCAVDYMRYYDKDDVTIDGFTVSIGVRF